MYRAPQDVLERVLLVNTATAAPLTFRKGPVITNGPSANSVNTNLFRSNHIFKSIFSLTRRFHQLGKPMLAGHAQIGEMQCHAKTHV